MKAIKITLALCTGFILFSSNSYSQSITIPDTLRGWNQTWVAGLNGAQAAYNNWSKGGVSSISGTASSVLNLLYRNEEFGYGFRVDLKYGQANIKGEGVRKTDDEISIRNRFTYPLGSENQLSLYAVAGFRSQFDRGYNYGAAIAGGDSLISNFFAPAYFDEGIGIAYAPGSNFKFEAGIGMKQTFVLDDNLTQNYGLTPGNNFKNEGGLITGINFKRAVAENIMFESNLETFTNLLIPISKTDVAWANELVGQINKIVSASFQFELRYDDDFSSQIQLKQVLSAGISVNLY